MDSLVHATQTSSDKFLHYWLHYCCHPQDINFIDIVQAILSHDAWKTSIMRLSSLGKQEHHSFQQVPQRNICLNSRDKQTAEVEKRKSGDAIIEQQRPHREVLADWWVNKTVDLTTEDCFLFSVSNHHHHPISSLNLNKLLTINLNHNNTEQSVIFNIF